MIKQPLYLALATLMQRQRNLSRPIGAGRGTDAQLQMKNDIEDEIERLVKLHMPSGSGFDNGTSLDCARSDSSVYRYPGRLSFATSYHHMDDHGYYCGWTEHFVDCTPDWDGFHLVVTGRDKRNTKDYIGDTFHNCLSAEVEVNQIPTPIKGGLDPALCSAYAEREKRHLAKLYSIPESAMHLPDSLWQILEDHRAQPAGTIAASAALLEIQRLLSGEEWDSDTLDAVATVLTAAGYEIQDSDEGAE